MSKKTINNFSNPKIVNKKAIKYLGENVKIKLSDKLLKKYMVLNPNTNKYVHFGQMGYKDFTKTGDTNKKKSYLSRSANIRGDWKDDKYSPNNLSRNILW